ncbi:hypothetical protein Bca52824_074820 [Brassica carinata]|uniref:Uncharacterized protein n=1 Tax=Brassica carinata TaxID=52824 RepID=A0A8X7TVX3_BRACI|nr:hypothetical protein Bca52824_074820 [Brassica carinata]
MGLIGEERVIDPIPTTHSKKVKRDKSFKKKKKLASKAVDAEKEKELFSAPKIENLVPDKWKPTAPVLKWSNRGELQGPRGEAAMKELCCGALEMGIGRLFDIFSDTKGGDLVMRGADVRDRRRRGLSSLVRRAKASNNEIQGAAKRDGKAI